MSPESLCQQEPRGLLVRHDRVQELKREAVELPSWDLTQAQVFDIELLMNGAFSPLEGYLTRRDYLPVLQNMRLASGALWPIPITLDVTEAFADAVAQGDRVALRHPEGMVLGILTVEDIWKPDLQVEAEAVYGTIEETHTGVFHLLRQSHPVYLGGKITGMELPPHHTFQPLRHTPRELRNLFQRMGWRKIVAFQTRNPMHRAHVEITKAAVNTTGANLLLHPVVGRTSPGDVNYFCRTRCYQAILKHYPQQTTLLSLLPLRMRMAGPREALWHGLIRRNYGATHFIVGRHHASPAKRPDGTDFYEPYAAQELTRKHEQEAGIAVTPFQEMVYVEEKATFLSADQVQQGERVLRLSATELRRRLREGLEIPEWFSYPDVVQELRQAYPPRSQMGFTCFFTGLSGSGKSTIANILVAKLMELGTRPVTLLDGDIVRKNLSSELTFSKEHRDLNILRIGYVASEITKNRGVAVCAPIAPYASIRRMNRDLIQEYGGYVEIHVATPLEVCEKRDRKGLYAQARAGRITNFTGISDPYEAPENPELTLDTTTMTADEAANEVLLYLEKEGYIALS